MRKNNIRLRELDFLRGIAILLVILRHQFLFVFSYRMGWIGVDLFFVLSGFLVSSLLFKEYIKHNGINVKLFLIRRGFKIYPIYYLFYGFYFFSFIVDGKSIAFFKVLSDLFFFQNYYNGWGYLNPASWSLAVEEHFYIGLSVFLWYISIKKPSFFIPIENKLNKFELILIAILGIVFMLRVYTNLFYPQLYVKNITMTHLRIDSLFFGVLISYWYCFKKDWLQKFFIEHENTLIFISFSMLMFSPFVKFDESFFVKTLGFTMLYLSFGLILITFLLKSNMNSILNKIFTKRIVDLISKIGFCSYSIYIIHMFVIDLVKLLKLNNHYINFILVLILSVLLGMLITFKIEKYFLTIRNKYFPSI